MSTNCAQINIIIPKYIIFCIHTVVCQRVGVDVWQKTLNPSATTIAYSHVYSYSSVGTISYFLRGVLGRLLDTRNNNL